MANAKLYLKVRVAWWLKPAIAVMIRVAAVWSFLLGGVFLSRFESFPYRIVMTAALWLIHRGVRVVPSSAP